MVRQMENTTFYNGEFELHKIHPYKLWDINKREWVHPPGVTTIVGQFSKDGLIQWAANEAAKCAIELYGTIPKNELLDKARKAYLNKRDTAADGGTEGHAWIEAYVRGEVSKDPSKYMFKGEFGEVFAKAFLQFEKDYNPSDHNPEIPLYSKAFNYAGIRDDYVMINGKRYTLDYKTGNPDFEYKAHIKRYSSSRQSRRIRLSSVP